MAKGRKPKPTWMKLIDGNPGKREINLGEPVPAESLGDPPDFMTPDQKAIWKKFAAHAPRGMLRVLDRNVYATLCVAVDQHEKASAEIEKLGLVVRNPQTRVPMQNPYVLVQHKMALLIMRSAAELGFSPTSRSRIKVDEESRETVFDHLKEFDED